MEDAEQENGGNHVRKAAVDKEDQTAVAVQPLHGMDRPYTGLPLLSARKSGL